MYLTGRAALPCRVSWHASCHAPCTRAMHSWNVVQCRCGDELVPGTDSMSAPHAMLMDAVRRAASCIRHFDTLPSLSPAVHFIEGR
jgi:hypothetical protein